MEDGLLKQPLPSVPEQLCPLDNKPYSDKESEVSHLTEPVHKEEEKTENAMP